MDSVRPTSPPNPSQGHRILVISADLAVCAAVKAAREPGDEVVCASNGQSGLLLFQEQTPDLVILDDILPDRSGLMVFQQLQSGTPNVPVIVATKTIMGVVTFMQAGCHDYLPKPFNTENLHMVMQKALEQKTLKRETAFLRSQVEVNFETRISRDPPRRINREITGWQRTFPTFQV